MGDGDSCDVEVGEESRIDAAVSAFAGSGNTVDSILYLTSITGATLRVLSSHITSWMESTPETRRKSVELNQILDNENKDLMAEFGIFHES